MTNHEYYNIAKEYKNELEEAINHINQAMTILADNPTLVENDEAQTEYELYQLSKIAMAIYVHNESLWLNSYEEN